jgi:L-iditol 2-dehydrogenase
MTDGVMRAAVLRGVGDVVLEDRPAPAPGPGEVLVRVGAVGVCGSDTHYFDHGRVGSHVVERPLVLGHEAAGLIVSVGAGVLSRRPGERVSIEPGRPDFTCVQCLAGRYNLCRNMRFFATPPIDGAFAELVVVHEAMAHSVPDALSDEAAALLEPLSVAVWACRKARVGAGTRGARHRRRRDRPTLPAGGAGVRRDKRDGLGREPGTVGCCPGTGRD